MISKSSGNSMGVIASFYADPNTLAVVAAQMRPKGLGSKVTATNAGTVPLDYFDKVTSIAILSVAPSAGASIPMFASESVVVFPIMLVGSRL